MGSLPRLHDTVLGRHSAKGIEAMSDDRLSVMECWDIAHRKYPYQSVPAEYCFLELMREHGHLVPSTDGKGVSYPCGYSPRERRAE